MTDGNSDQRIDVAIVGGGIAGLWRPRTSCRRAVCSVRVLEAVGARRRRHRHRALRRLGHRRRPRLAAGAEAGGGRALPRAGHRRSAGLDAARRAPRTCCATAGCTRSPKARSSAFRSRSARSPARRCSRSPARLRMAGEVLVPRRTVDEDESIGAFVRRRFGQEAVDYLAEPLLAGIHAGDVDRLSIRALFPRLVEAERQIGQRAFARSARCTFDRSPQGAFVSLPGGTGELVDALLRRADARYGRDRRACHRDLRRGRRLRDRLDRGAASQARASSSRCPPTSRARCCARFDTRWPLLCDAIPYASTATVAFGYRRDQVAHPMQGTGFVVPRVEALRAPRRHVGHVEVAGPRARGSRAAARVPRRRPRSASPRRIATRSSSTLRGAGAQRAARHHRRSAVHAAVPLDAPEPAVRGRPPAARRGASSSASTRCQGCSSPAAASAPSASPTASPTAAPLRLARPTTSHR